MTKTSVTHHEIAGVIEIHRNRPMVSSLKIAELFERNHRDVLRAIRKELSAEISLRKIAQSESTNSRGKRDAARVLTDAIIDMRSEQGKDTAAVHYMSEQKLCNWAVVGEFKAIDEASLSNEDLELLRLVRERNAALIAAELDYSERKARLSAYAIRQRTKLLAAPEPAA